MEQTLMMGNVIGREYLENSCENYYFLQVNQPDGAIIDSIQWELDRTVEEGFELLEPLAEEDKPLYAKVKIDSESFVAGTLIARVEFTLEKETYFETFEKNLIVDRVIT